MAIYPGGLWRPIGTNQRDRRIGLTELKKGAICQHSAEGYGSLYRLFSDPDRNGSTHFWISKGGVVEQYVDTAKCAWGNGCTSSGSSKSTPEIKAWAQAGLCNDYTIASIELEGVRGEPMNDAQAAAASALWKWLAATYGITLKKDDTVYRHYHFNSTLCDSDRWATDKVISMAAGTDASYLDAFAGLWDVFAFWYGKEGYPFYKAPLVGSGLPEHYDKTLAYFVNKTNAAIVAMAQEANPQMGSQLAASMGIVDASDKDVKLCDGLGD